MQALIGGSWNSNGPGQPLVRTNLNKCGRFSCRRRLTNKLEITSRILRGVSFTAHGHPQEELYIKS